MQPVAPAWGPEGFDPYNPGGVASCDGMLISVKLVKKNFAICWKILKTFLVQNPYILILLNLSLNQKIQQKLNNIQFDVYGSDWMEKTRNHQQETLCLKAIYDR